MYSDLLKKVFLPQVEVDECIGKSVRLGQSLAISRQVGESRQTTRMEPVQ